MIEALARSIRSISEFPAFKSSSLSTSSVGDGMRALESRSVGAVACVEEKRAISSKKRLLMSRRDKLGSIYVENNLCSQVTTKFGYNQVTMVTGYKT